MSMYGLMHSTAHYKVGDKESLLNALKSLSDIDGDFNGENGLDYVSEEAKINGFESDQDYNLSMINEIDNEEDIIEQYITDWLINDSFYYEWSYDIKTHDNIRFISVAMLTRC